MTARCPACGQPIPAGRNAADEGFAQFWAAYPRKKSKGQAAKVWQRMRPDAELRTRIMDGLSRALRSPEWLKEGGQYIPYPATWLNSLGWEDEPMAQLPAPVAARPSKTLQGLAGLARMKRDEDD